MPPRRDPIQAAEASLPGAPRVETYSSNNVTKAGLGGKRRNVQKRPIKGQRQQQRYLPKNRSNARRTRNASINSPLLASPNQPASLGDSYDYSVPSSSTEGQEKEVAKDHLQQQQTGTTANTTLSPYGNGMFGGMGGYNSMMMAPPPMYMGSMGMGPFSGLYQVLYGVQNVVFSISQAVQLVGMNQQALQQSWESLTKMVDHAIATFHEMRALELHYLEREEAEEDRQRRKRLKALRYALVMGGSWLAYKIMRHLLFAKRNRRRQVAISNSYNSGTGLGWMGALGMSSMSPYSSPSYYGGGGYSPYSSMNNMGYSGGGYF